MKISIGPGALVAAAFIGPGTVTTCTLAGAKFGFELVWALVFATIATIILQDMATRLGAAARKGLGEALMASIAQPYLRLLAAGLVVLALGVGNAAYESGNLAGGALGIEAMSGSQARRIITLVLALVAGAILMIGEYKPIERILTAMVAVLAASFALAAVIARPGPADLAAGLVPRIPEGGELTTIALVGTTIVPYNLFLHAAAARRRWKASGELSEARFESAASIGLGGVVSILILSTAAASLFSAGIEVKSASDMALALEPAFGPVARHLVGVGLFAAGLTSAVTAPMATAYALGEIFPAADESGRVRRFRWIALAIVIAGAGISLFGIDVVTLIVTAQAANGLLLPIMAMFLMFVMNQRSMMGSAVNGAAANLGGSIVILVTLGLGARGVLRAIGTVLGS